MNEQTFNNKNCLDNIVRKMFAIIVFRQEIKYYDVIYFNLLRLPR